MLQAEVLSGSEVLEPCVSRQQAFPGQALESTVTLRTSGQLASARTVWVRQQPLSGQARKVSVHTARTFFGGSEDHEVRHRRSAFTLPAPSLAAVKTVWSGKRMAGIWGATSKPAASTFWATTGGTGTRTCTCQNKTGCSLQTASPQNATDNAHKLCHLYSRQRRQTQLHTPKKIDCSAHFETYLFQSASETAHGLCHLYARRHRHRHMHLRSCACTATLLQRHHDVKRARICTNARVQAQTIGHGAPSPDGNEGQYYGTKAVMSAFMNGL
eukprot:1161491-Pelagomonas_calceolata.AAC.17